MSSILADLLPYIKPKKELSEAKLAVIQRNLEELRAQHAQVYGAMQGNTLVQFAGSLDFKFWDFRMQELESLTELVCDDLDVKSLPRELWGSVNTCLRTNIPVDRLEAVAQRSIGIRGAYEVYAYGYSLDELFANLATNRANAEHLLDGESLRVDVTSINATYTVEQKMAIRKRFDALNPKAKIHFSLNQSNMLTVICEHFPLRHCPDSEVKDILTTYVPFVYYVVRTVVAKDTWFMEYDLRTRPCIGPTSCDHQLAFLMANMGKVTKHTQVFDPFVGTGSILVAAAKQGALVYGQDLDWKVLHGKLKGQKNLNIFDNFRHYNFQRPELICADTAAPALRDTVRDQTTFYPPHATMHPLCKIVKTVNGVAVDTELAQQQEVCWTQQKTENEQRRDDYFVKWKNEEHKAADKKPSLLERRELWDVILTDPPYGIRAGARKLGATKEDSRKNTSILHIPQTKPYPVEEVMYDLLHLAAQQLKLGGRLVYLIPTNLDFVDGELPEHPCLRLVYNCNQRLLNGDFSRRAVTMEKIRAFDPVEDELWMQKQKLLPTPRWALLNETVLKKETGTVKPNGRIHLARKDRKLLREREELPEDVVWCKKRQRLENKLGQPVEIGEGNSVIVLLDTNNNDAKCKQQ